MGTSLLNARPLGLCIIQIDLVNPGIPVLHFSIHRLQCSVNPLVTLHFLILYKLILIIFNMCVYEKEKEKEKERERERERGGEGRGKGKGGDSAVKYLQFLKPEAYL